MFILETIAGYESGTIIADRYQVVGFLGVGAMGMVFEVADQHLKGERLALKLLHPHLVVTERSLERFKNETLLARKLQSPSIVRFFEFGKTRSDQYYVTMELVEGVCLADIIDQGALSIDEALDIARQIANGLEVAHRVGVIHRDVKPQNILITSDGVAKLTDFGTARMLVGEAETLTRTGEAVGTPHYMAPEQFRAGEVDELVDVYALGISLYEMLTGEKPFKAETYLELAMQQLEAPVPCVTEREPPLPDYLAEIIEKATKKDPEKRFSSIGDFSEAIVERCADFQSKEKDSIARDVFEKAMIQDRIVQKRKIVFNLRQMLCILFLSTMGFTYVLSRMSPNLMMHLAVPFLKLEKTPFVGLGRFGSYWVNAQKSSRRADVFQAISAASLSAKDRYLSIAEIRAGMDVETPRVSGETPLMYAYSNGQFRLAEEILKRGVEVNARDRYGRTAVYYLIKNSANYESLDRLRDFGADLEVDDDVGDSLLHRSAFNHSADLLQYFIEKHPNLVNRKNKAGKTALYIAVGQAIGIVSTASPAARASGEFRNKLAAVLTGIKSLLDAGSDPQLADNSGNTPLSNILKRPPGEQKYLEDFILLLKEYHR